MGPPPPLPPLPPLTPPLLLLTVAGIAMAYQDIVHGLGLSRIPDMTKANISQAEWSRMTELYLQRVAQRQLADAAADAAEVDVLYTFHGAGSRPRRSASSSSPRTRLRMELPAEAGEVSEAEVRVLAQRAGSLKLFELGAGGRRLLAERTVSSPGWTQLDVGQAASGARTMLLELRCDAHCQDAALNVLAAPGRRTKRAAARPADCGKDGHRCCRHSLEVEFAQIPGMEFVMQPKRFDAGFCRGRCPPRFHPAHHHALIQGLLRRRGAAGAEGGPRSRVPRPCCAPARLQPLDVLYVDEDDPTKLKLSEWSEMRVVDCSCA